MKIELNPFEVPAKSLRTLAHFFNCLAADSEGVPHQSSPVHPVLNIDTRAGNGVEDIPPPPPPLAPNPGNSPGASGASDQLPTSDNAPAPAGSNTHDASDLDKNGFPWDERIHSSTKNRNQDGTWRYTRGGDPAVRAQVEAELRAKGFGQPSADDTPPPPPPIPDVGAGQTPPPPPPLADQPEDPTPLAATVTMQQVFGRASKLDVESRNMALESVGLATMAEFLKEVKVRPELAEELYTAIVTITGEE